MGILSKLLHGRDSEKMLDGVEMVKMGVLNRLFERYKGVYGQETANFLSGAVVHELFGERPADPVAVDFFTANKNVVDRETANLKYDDKVCEIVTQAIRIKRSLIREQDSQKTKSLNEHIEALTKLGIFHPDVYTPEPNSFWQMADAFVHGK